MADTDKKGFNKDSVAGTLIVAFLVCLACAIVVASAAVALKPQQDANIERDRQKNILAAAGLLDPNLTVEEQFESVKTYVVDLRTGEYTDAVDPVTYDNLKAAKTVGDLSSSFEDLGTDDIAQIGRRENYSVIYHIDNENGDLDKIILPIRGYGLWSTLQGFVALEADLTTVAGIGFYAHKETPGLGGEVDNPSWTAIWPGKQIYSGKEVALDVIKGAVIPGNPNEQYQIDGLAGATLTSNGVDSLIKFWLGEQGFALYLNKLSAGEV